MKEKKKELVFYYTSAIKHSFIFKRHFCFHQCSFFEMFFITCFYHRSVADPKHMQSYQCMFCKCLTFSDLKDFLLSATLHIVLKKKVDQLWHLALHQAVFEFLLVENPTPCLFHSIWQNHSTISYRYFFFLIYQVYLYNMSQLNFRRVDLHYWDSLL